MPKFICTCGETIPLFDIPAKDEFSLIPEAKVVELVDFAGAQARGRDALYEFIDHSRRAVFQCPACRRLHVETGVNTKKFEAFASEVQKPSSPNDRPSCS